MITKEKIERINALAKKAKTEEGLTEEEQQEQKKLRREYIDSFKANLKAQLDNIKIVEEEEKKEGRTEDQYVIELEEDMD